MAHYEPELIDGIRILRTDTPGERYWAFREDADSQPEIHCGPDVDITAEYLQAVKARHNAFIEADRQAAKG